MAEQELVIDLGFDNLLRRLNYLVTRFATFEKDLGFLKETSSKLTSDEIKKLVKFIRVKLKEMAGKDNAATYTSVPETLFKNNATPWIGTSTSDSLYNENFVIGLKDPSNRISYRIDYDPKKLFHVNLELFHHSFSIAVNPQSKTFFVQSTGENTKIKGDEEEGQMVKFKYWTKMTLAYAVICKKKQHSQYTLPFCNLLDLTFNDLKVKLANVENNPDLCKKIMSCASQETLMELIYDNKKLRDYFVQCVIEKRTDYACCYEANVETNSDTLSDASPPSSPVSHKHKAKAAAGPSVPIRYSKASVPENTTQSVGKGVCKKPSCR